jgi:tellurite resistance protein
MGLKEKMADRWMENMDPQEKQKMLDSMMDNFFSKMSAEEKAKMMETMMEKFMAGLSPEEKQAMMGTMMPKMMGGLMSGQDSPLSGMMGLMMGKGGPMREMMSKMMGRGGEEGEGEGPWNMCQKMMASIGKSSELATFATPEVRGLFDEWAAQIEAEILQFVKESTTVEADQVAARFKLSKDSANYFLTRLSQQGKISLKAEKAAEK